MLHKLKWPILVFLRYYRSLGLRVTLYALLALLIAGMTTLVDRYLPSDLADLASFDSVTPVLTILASSMLAVSTFSLNVMVTAHRAAASTTTPRVHRLLLQDTTTQSVLASFIGAFVYSLAAIVLYRTGIYSASDAVVVMATTVLVVVVIIIAMLRWIKHLSELGSVDDSLRLACDHARAVLQRSAEDRSLGGTALTPDIRLPPQVTPLNATCSGYIQMIDTTALQDALPPQGAIYLSCRPGMHILIGQELAQVAGGVDSETLGALREAFVLGDVRSHEQDARFGMHVLSEIACRALSPGINDSGTAIDAIDRMKTLLWEFDLTEPRSDRTIAPQVFVPPLDGGALIRAAYTAVSRDGADRIEVATALRRALQALAVSRDPAMQEAARALADSALDRSRAAGMTTQDAQRLEAIVMPV